MRLTLLICLSLLSSLSFAADDSTRLSPRFQTVYVLQMSQGLDQYLTGRLTSSHVLWVVLEPTSADAVLTDTVDEAFWTWLTRIYPPAPGTPTDPDRGAFSRREVQYGPRSRGTVFLVDPRRRVVLWSAYALPRGGSPSEMDKAANQITSQLKAAFGKK